MATQAGQAAARRHALAAQAVNGWTNADLAPPRESSAAPSPSEQGGPPQPTDRRRPDRWESEDEPQPSRSRSTTENDEPARSPSGRPAATVLEMAKPRPPRVPIRFSARAEADDVDTLIRLLHQQAARCIPTATLSGSVYIEEHKRRGEVDDAPRYWGRAVFEAG